VRKVAAFFENNPICGQSSDARTHFSKIDPLTCPKCHGPMAVIAFIEAEDVIEKILKHLALWELTPRPPPPIPKAQSQHTVHHSTI